MCVICACACACVDGRSEQNAKIGMHDKLDSAHSLTQVPHHVDLAYEVKVANVAMSKDGILL